MAYVVITGAYGGMGRKTAELFRDNSYTVFALDKKIEEKEEGIIPIYCDVTDINSIKDAFNTIKKTTDSVDAIVHFAGIYMLDSLVEISEERFKKIYEINVFGPYLINKTFLPLLKNGSKIIMTTSELASLDPLPFTGIYGITKAALDKYSYSLAMELQLLGIKVVVIRPGAVKTDLLGVSTKELDKFCDNTKLYDISSKNFRDVVNNVEANYIMPEKLAKKVFTVFNKKNPRYAYYINRNKLLVLLNILPKKMQFMIIRNILKKDKKQKKSGTK